jgi:hypothetical protein
VSLKFPPLLYIALVGLPFLSGCSDLGDPYTAPRVFVGEGFDGAKIGQTPPEVEGALGPPEIYGVWDGFGAGGPMTVYEHGPHGYLCVGFHNPLFSAEDTTWGTVYWMRVRSPYDGKTEKGIGLSSSQNEVRAAYGKPDSSYGIDSDVYFFGKTQFYLGYDTAGVNSMGMYLREDLDP